MIEEADIIDLKLALLFFGSYVTMLVIVALFDDDDDGED